MGGINIYIRKELVVPFEKYCRRTKVREGTRINQLIKDKLIEEGFLNAQDS